jgi:CRP-like cAMP-binding protein
MSPLFGPSWDPIWAGPIIWPPNACLLERSVAPEAVYVLDEGTVKMIYITVDGEERVVDVRRAPALVGVAFALAGCHASVDVVTVTKCSLRWCSAREFLCAAANDATRAADVLRWQSAEIVTQCDRAIAMSLKTPGQRLDHFMARYGLVSPDHHWPSGLPFKQSLVASCINVTPEHLSRLMKKWADARNRLRSAALVPVEVRKLRP